MTLYYSGSRGICSAESAHRKEYSPIPIDNIREHIHVRIYTMLDLDRSSKPAPASPAGRKQKSAKILPTCVLQKWQCYTFICRKADSEGKAD